ncbi:hypothetical protein Cgig2_032461 [Carnegiea gigantea]|uniref:Uncharacterized protein n=1 Tax=Carnegiea gigantea TaxID=171969 RepID=A0A9Q1KTV9_9CARY|nr:hypothetical protein Cgig2_032461 [Carnegiea gigantea]
MKKAKISKGKKRMAKIREETQGLFVVTVLLATISAAKAIDTNPVHDPCSDAEVQKWDGFTFGLAFSSKDSFYASDGVQLSPCDTRLQLANKAQLAVFRARVDEISLLTINSTFDPAKSGGYMVAFAGRKYAARSPPVFVADTSNTITTFTLVSAYSLSVSPFSLSCLFREHIDQIHFFWLFEVLEFQKGTLQNLYWKKFGCDSCSRESHCSNGECAVETSKCKGNGGSVDCTMRIQLTFSGTDKSNDVLNSWYEMKNMRRFSFYGLFANLRDSITNTLF